jgi:hypothetical protein
MVAAVGDGPDDGPDANALAQSIVLTDHDLFLFLGDIYENGTFVENLKETSTGCPTTPGRRAP